MLHWIENGYLLEQKIENLRREEEKDEETEIVPSLDVDLTDSHIREVEIGIIAYVLFYPDTHNKTRVNYTITVERRFQNRFASTPCSKS
jgi:hypothetical protein